MSISKLSLKTTPLVPLLHLSDPGAFVDVDGDPTNNDFGTVPKGGTSGQVLKKSSNKDYDVEWGAGGGGGSDLPEIEAGDIGKALTVIDDGEDPKAAWIDPKASVIPSGGAYGQVLMKASNDNYAYQWRNIPSVHGKASALNQGAGTFEAPSTGQTSDVNLPDLTDAEDWGQLFPQVGDMRNLPIIFMMRGILHMKKSTDAEYATDKMMVVCDWLGFYTHDGKNPEGIDMKTIRASIGGFTPLRLCSVSSDWFDYISPDTLPSLAMMADWEEPISPFPGQACMRPIFDPQNKTLKIVSNSDMTAGDTYNYYWDFYLYY